MKLQDVQETIIEMRSAGYGYKRIAQVLNANPASVKRWIAKLGLPTKLETSKPESAREIQCASCNKTVKTIRYNTKYCSDACRQRERKIALNGRKKCKGCKESIIGLQNVAYCASKCKDTHLLSTKRIRLIYNQCIVCGCTKLSRRKSMFCSETCRREHKDRVVKKWYQENKETILQRVKDSKQKRKAKCKECSCFYETTKKNSFCTKVCAKKYHNRKKEVIRRERIVSNGKVDWSISIERLTKRDGKTCYLCKESMEYQTHYNDDNYPSIEHVKPISKGGTHTWDNVKLAHRKCNAMKSNVWIEQKI